VKVLIASGFSANGRIGEVVRTGARGFVTKPFDVGQILNMIREVIDGKP
jgi:DNA-binding NarL/FixJ family response regulator